MKEKMTAHFIICEACGCKGSDGNLSVNSRTSAPVFRHLGHDPYTGDMHYSCVYCGVVLAVDPMEMLFSSCVKGVPCNRANTNSGNLKNRAILQSGQLLKKAFREIFQS
jgi:hypothetical protein